MIGHNQRQGSEDLNEWRFRLSLLINHGTNYRNLTLCSHQHPKILPSTRPLNISTHCNWLMHNGNTSLTGSFITLSLLMSLYCCCHFVSWYPSGRTAARFFEPRDLRLYPLCPEYLWNELSHGEYAGFSPRAELWQCHPETLFFGISGSQTWVRGRGPWWWRRWWHGLVWRGCSASPSMG